MQKNYFIAQESSRYSVRKQDWFFLLFVYIKVSQKNWFLYMNENYNDCHQLKTTRTFLYTQKSKICETFLYTKSQTFFKNLDNFRYVFTYKMPYTLLTSHTQGDHDATCWSRGRPSMVNIRVPWCSGVGRSGRDGDWRRQSCGKSRRRPSRPMGNNSRRYQVLSNWEE